MIVNIVASVAVCYFKTLSYAVLFIGGMLATALLAAYLCNIANFLLGMGD